MPPLPLQVSPVLGCRYFGATFVPFTEPAFLTPYAVAADLRELRLQLGPFRLKKLIDIPAHREQLGYGKVFYIGRWHYALQMKLASAL